MNYPYRTDDEQATLEHMPAGPYNGDDLPHLSTARYSVIGYEPREVDAKRALDMQGAADMVWWTEYNRQAGRAVNIGQR